MLKLWILILAILVVIITNTAIANDSCPAYSIQSLAECDKEIFDLVDSFLKPFKESGIAEAMVMENFEPENEKYSGIHLIRFVDGKLAPVDMEKVDNEYPFFRHRLMFFLETSQIAVNRLKLKDFSLALVQTFTFIDQLE